MTNKEYRTNRFTVSFTDSEIEGIDKHRGNESRSDFVRRGALGLASLYEDRDIIFAESQNILAAYQTGGITIGVEVLDTHCKEDVTVHCNDYPKRFCRIYSNEESWACGYILVHDLDADTYIGSFSWAKSSHDPIGSMCDGLFDKDGNEVTELLWANLDNDTGIDPESILDHQGLAIYRARKAAFDVFINATFTTLVDALKSWQMLLGTD